VRVLFCVLSKSKLFTRARSKTERTGHNERAPAFFTMVFDCEACSFSCSCSLHLRRHTSYYSKKGQPCSSVYGERAPPEDIPHAVGDTAQMQQPDGLRAGPAQQQGSEQSDDGYADDINDDDWQAIVDTTLWRMIKSMNDCQGVSGRDAEEICQTVAHIVDVCRRHGVSPSLHTAADVEAMTTRELGAVDDGWMEADVLVQALDIGLSEWPNPGGCMHAGAMHPACIPAGIWQKCSWCCAMLRYAHTRAHTHTHTRARTHTHTCAHWQATTARLRCTFATWSTSCAPCTATLTSRETTLPRTR
jgi:hypothetical protein